MKQKQTINAFTRMISFKDNSFIRLHFNKVPEIRFLVTDKTVGIRHSLCFCNSQDSINELLFEKTVKLHLAVRNDNFAGCAFDFVNEI